MKVEIEIPRSYADLIDGDAIARIEENAQIVLQELQRQHIAFRSSVAPTSRVSMPTWKAGSDTNSATVSVGKDALGRIGTIPR